ncbi:hypothetical protein EON65_52980, partial [archaeon]
MEPISFQGILLMCRGNNDFDLVVGHTDYFSNKRVVLSVKGRFLSEIDLGPKTSLFTGNRHHTGQFH